MLTYVIIYLASVTIAYVIGYGKRGIDEQELRINREKNKHRVLEEIYKENLNREGDI